MSGSLKGLEEDIASLEEGIVKLAQEFNDAYENYLRALGKAVRQQLILAIYHLCTQGYPESFLKLSYSDREKLQQNLQAVASNTQKSLLALVQLSSASQALEEKEPEQIQPEQTQQTEEIDEDEDDLDEDDDPLEGLLCENESLELSADLLLGVRSPEPLSLPERLAKWQEDLEKSIHRLLKTLSQESNLLLRKANLFPIHFPEAVIDAATEAPGDTSVASPPNLLNLMIQTENPSDDDESPTNVARLIAVHLRLSEIEFADANLMSARHRIRHLSAQLNKAGRSYQKKQRERTVLEAEAAWRASWFEDFSDR